MDAIRRLGSLVPRCLPSLMAVAATLALAGPAEAQVCGDGICLAPENCNSCPEDCLNAICDPGENCTLCPGDCGSCCGNGSCQPALGEDCTSCPGDCGSCCGNGQCEPGKGENCTTCPGDCGSCCGNGQCEPGKGENCTTCPGDCGSCCGNGQCEPGKGEDCTTCPGDCGSCPPACNNEVCEPGETWKTCAKDCVDSYVRDWTNTAAAHDDGAEPSTDPVFYDRSDVWNRLGNAPGPFADDKPTSQDPVTSSMGTNFGFVRVHRKSPLAIPLPAATVGAEFFHAQGGLGSNFVSAGTVSLNFLAGEAVKISPGHAWTLPDTASGHLCFAVEITAPGDPPLSPGILGGFAGQGIQADNNKAQRNLTVVSVPSPAPQPPPLPDGGGTGGEGRRMGFWAIAHNGLTYPRTMVVRYELSPETLKTLGRAEVEVVGGERAQLRTQGELRLSDMKPGENRWIGLTVDLPAEGTRELLPVTFTETPPNAQLASGFTIAFQPMPLSGMIPESLRAHRATLTRLGTLYAMEAALAQARSAEHAGKAKLAPAEYLKVMQEWLPALDASVERLLRTADVRDPFRLRRAVWLLRGSLRARDEAGTVVSHASLLNRLDAFLTMLQLADGDPADIRQNVYWQISLFSRLPAVSGKPYARAVVDLSTAFIESHSGRPAEPDYVGFMDVVLPELRKAVADLGQPKLGMQADLAAIERQRAAPAALQKAHRGLLLKLQSLVR